MLFTAGDDAQIKVWDLVTKSCVATLKAHFSAVTCLSLAHDGWTLFSGGRDGVVVAWDLRKYEKKATVPVYEAVEGVVAVPPATARALILLSNTSNNATGSIKNKSNDNDNNTTNNLQTNIPLCFATGGEKGIVRIWRSDNGQQLTPVLVNSVNKSNAALD